MIPDQPSREDSFAAAHALLDVVKDFPFLDDAARSSWLALVLTYFARPAIDGSVPLFVVDANVRGAGKSLLAQVAAIIMTGREAATMIWTESEAENHKGLTTLFMNGDPVILFDNVTTTIGGAAIDIALTSPIWKSRLLCQNRDTGPLPIRSVIVATSNNATFGSDTIRRTIRIRLHSPYAHPEDRTDVKEETLRLYVKEHRSRLAVAALTILRAFTAVPINERPKVPPMGEYVGWRHIRQICVWLGLIDPLQTQKSLAELADTDAGEHRALMAGMRGATMDGEWLTAGKYLARAEAGLGSGWSGLLLKEVLMEHLPGRGPGELPSAKSFGWRLTRYRDRVADDMVIVCRRTAENMLEWQVAVAASRETTEV
jgi:hypothetical protein